MAVMQQAAAQGMLEEVIITAQKREQNLQDVPVAVTAFTGEQMSAMGVQQSYDIAAFSPGVHTSGNLAGQNTQFSIRGVTQNDFNDIIEAPNAVYLDEGYIAIAQAQTFALFDIDRVEILKGPQGTLFGRNATGGLVHYLSNRPDFDRTNGYVNLTTGQFDSEITARRHTLEAALSGPLSERLAGRVALRYSDQDPYLENTYPDSAFLPAPGPGAGADLGGEETIAGRLSLTFRPSDTLQIDLSVNHAETDVSTGPFQSKPTIGVVENGELINVIDMPADETRLSIEGDGDGGADIIDGDQLLPGGGIGLDQRPVPGGDFFGYVAPSGDDFSFSGDFAFDDQGFTESSGINVKVAWDLDNSMSFTSITDWKRYEKLLFIDVDAAPVNQTANFAGVDADSVTQELRLSGETTSSRWVAGFYYLYIDNTSDNGLKAPANSIAGGTTPLDIGVVAELETNSYSLFGQYEYDLTPTVSATAGLRLMQEEKDYDMASGIFPSFSNHTGNQGDFIPNAFGAGSPFFFQDSTSDTLWTGKLQLDWRPNDDLLLYAGVNRGVKAGSFNALVLGQYLGSGGDEALPYDEEVLTSYEGGFKATLGNGMTRLNGSVFYYDYSDYQAFLFVGVGGVVINADAENYGAELELITSPIDGLDLMFTTAWFDATVKDISLRNGSPLPPRDVKPTYAPELQATALARYAWSAFGGTMAIQGDVNYSDEFYYNLRNFDADKFDSYTLVNAQLSWESPLSAWTTTLAVRNLTDERAGVQGFNLATLCGCNEVAYRTPRFYSVGLRYDF
ncbi:TonB-dependent receptor [Kineobactrum salinum]|uniref:TonB-dependent receptor n=2 Tax=Kineobactrum salinum TaxID=2708301 RepID=A0A6C0U803_9GAMM|nr:TonB-dependent receptor [Kineobactrum salinum]